MNERTELGLDETHKKRAVWRDDLKLAKDMKKKKKT